MTINSALQKGLLKEDNMKGFTMTITVGDICSHMMNGWWVTVPYFFGMFSKYVYVCSDCGKMLTEKHYDDLISMDALNE
jgi:hypothetical protein